MGLCCAIHNDYASAECQFPRNIGANPTLVPERLNLCEPLVRAIYKANSLAWIERDVHRLHVETAVEEVQPVDRLHVASRNIVDVNTAALGRCARAWLCHEKDVMESIVFDISGAVDLVVGVGQPDVESEVRG
jgi:hypothetical protein